MSTSVAASEENVRPEPNEALSAEGAAQPGSPLKWGNVSFLLLVHLMAIYAVVYLFTVQFSWWTIGLGAFWYLLCGLSITAGYHRCFSHAAYKSHPAVRAFYLIFGAASFQNSALNWCGDHRAHHADTEGPEDPYSIQRGFWWAHVVWVLHKGASNSSRVRDLEAQRLMRFQDRYWMAIGTVVGLAIPMALGLLWGDPIGALLVAGFLRLALQLHCTFFVNSVAHLFGSRPFSLRETARDNALTALVTLGEGYHNFHHRFQFDYRCGRLWYQFDPTKWWINSLAACGLARNLKTAPARVIENARREVLEACSATDGDGNGAGAPTQMARDAAAAGQL